MAANSRRQRLDLHRRIFIRIFEKIEPEIIAFEFVCVCVCVCVSTDLCFRSVAVDKWHYVHLQK